jgi:putative membrane protein
MFCNRFGVGGYGFGGYGYGGPNFFMMIPTLIIFLVIAYFIYKAISSKNLNLAVDKASSKAMDILNERFAKGEINEEEYKLKKSQVLK